MKSNKRFQKKSLSIKWELLSEEDMILILKQASIITLYFNWNVKVEKLFMQRCRNQFIFNVWFQLVGLN